MTRARAKRWARALGVLALFVLAFLADRLRPRGAWARRAHLRDIAAQLFPPDWSYLSAIVPPLLATLRMSVTGTALGVVLALGFAPLCAHNLPCPAPVRAVLRFLVQVLRSFPALILALLATFLFGLGTFSGTVAITVFTLAVMTRLTYEDIETLTLAPLPCAVRHGRVPGTGICARRCAGDRVRLSDKRALSARDERAPQRHPRLCRRGRHRSAAQREDLVAGIRPRRHNPHVPVCDRVLHRVAQPCARAHHPRRAQHFAPGKARSLGGGAAVRGRLHGGHRPAGLCAHEQVRALGHGHGAAASGLALFFGTARTDSAGCCSRRSASRWPERGSARCLPRP